MAVNSYGQEMLNKYISYKHRVNRALEEGRIFRIVGHYDWPRLRQELLKRGWIEKRHFPSDNPIADLPHSILLEEARPGNDYERALIARMIGRTKPTWMWMLSGKYYYRNLDIPILNKLYVRNCNFGGKDGLQKYFEIMDYGNHPRGYNLIECKCLDIFIEDYYLTAATSLVLFLDNHQCLYERFTKEENSIPWSAIITVFQFVQTHIDNAQYGMNVSQENIKNSGMDEQKAQIILATYINIVKNGMRIETYHNNVQDHIPIIRNIAQKVRETWPQRIHDGYMNTWLLKPAYSGQGNGIMMSADIQEIVNIVKEDTDTKKYIVQKYIERPLLVYNTKFDLRQYFLLTVHKNKMRGWAHSKCTVRLASEEFTFDRFSRAIHITNTAVQRRIKKRSNEHLPEYHMWGIKDLVQYLWKMGKPHAWQEIIFPQIKRTLVSFMKSAAPNIEQRPGRFEIFGCDWLVTEDLQTYMLEINRSPALYYYTEVSVDVVGTVMNDLIKVTVDYMKDETASTGGFELICEIDMSTLEPFDVDWSQYYRPRKSVTPTDDINDYLFEVTRQSSVEPCPDENIIPRPPSPPPLPLPEPDPATQNKKVVVKPLQAKTVPTIIIDAVQQQQEDNKNVLKENTKGNIMTGTASASEKKIEDKMYILPPSKRSKNNSNDKNNTNNANENNNNSAVHNVENTLSQPEMGQDFDPYGESLITY